MAVVKKSTIPLNPDNTFNLDELKRILIGMCAEKEMLDDFLIKLIVGECELMKMEHRVSKPTTQIYLESALENELPGDETFSFMMDFIKSGSPGGSSDDDILDIELDIG
jgi:hypothetical protein